MQVITSMVVAQAAQIGRQQGDRSDAFWKRVELLQKEDRILLELALRAGASHRQIGRMVGRTPGSVSRALARVGRRLHDPMSLRLLDPACPLEPVYRQIAVERRMVGLSTLELSQKHGLSRVRIRYILQMVETWYDGFGKRSAARGRVNLY